LQRIFYIIFLKCDFRKIFQATHFSNPIFRKKCDDESLDKENKSQHYWILVFDFKLIWLVIEEVGFLTKAYTEHGGRLESNFHDLIVAFKELRISLRDLIIFASTNPNVDVPFLRGFQLCTLLCLWHHTLFNVHLISLHFSDSWVSCSYTTDSTKEFESFWVSNSTSICSFISSFLSWVSYLRKNSCTFRSWLLNSNNQTDQHRNDSRELWILLNWQLNWCWRWL
jgi:hypothetical protein